MASPVADAGSSAGVPGRKLTTIDLVGGIYCHICTLTFGNKKEYDSHYLMHETGSKEIVYTCVACHVTSNSYPSFRGHCYTNHVIKDRFKCQYCNKTLSKLPALKEHIEAMHTFKCNSPSCDKQFLSKMELSLHQILHKNDVNKPPYQCQTCTEEIDGIVSCEDHIDKHCMFSYSCPICNENITKENAANHLTKHFGNTDLTDEDSRNSELNENPEDSSITIVGGILCCYCNNLFKNRIEIDTHFAEEHPGQEVLYSCNICPKQYEKYSMFGNHCYYHFSKNRFVCESCDKTFPRLSLLVIHAEAHSGGGGAGQAEARFPCARCSRVFQTARRLRDHERAQHHVRALACPEPGCPHVFETPKDLILHRKHHETALDTWCRQCGLQFPTLASADKHIDVHKKKLFSCPVCARQYGEKYLLMKHIPQHFETVFHMCKVCGKIFNAKNRLSEHVKVHSNIKNYECKFCGKGFLRPYQLRQHLNIHTGARPYQCVACPKTFASLPNWQKHVRRMHNIDPKIKKKTDETNIQNNYEVVLKKERQIDSFELDENGQDKKTYDFCVDEGMVELESVDAKLVAIEAQRYEYEVDVKSMSADSDSIDDLTPILPDDANEFVSEILGSGEVVALSVAPAIPCEYGPDFTRVTEPDQLPHINPALLTAPPPALVQDSVPAWEPRITKVYGGYSGYYTDLDDHFSIIDTDIF
ncbi:zinc finger protein 569-like [Pectinophora gossypiella]|nr:zinc finger protein 569-like [Pectinophora gossypiella]